ncbi:MAG TPA: DUF2341 domain-containing protein, partial [Candidatus Saccharimonadales bacterium]|nr:DUF2341 domain-containing protein [Candidatus Saccharimonadales bacterium]
MSTFGGLVVTSVALNPANVVGGNGSQGTVTLNGPAPSGGTVVALTSSNTAAAQVPANATVAANATTATFSITTSTVASSTSSTITANYNGSSQAATLTILPPVSVSSLVLNPTSVVGGSNWQGTVTLSAAAPSGGISVSLNSDNTAAQVPPSVTVAAGATSAVFTGTTTNPATQTTAHITASSNSSSQTASLTIAPSGSATYRSAITVANPGGTTLTAYQVHIVLGASFDFTKAQSNGTDIRFTASDGVTALPFWIESWNRATSSASLWVNVPTIDSVNGATLYMYYGNSTAASASSGNSTFDFFDDFSGGTVDPTKWTATGGTWSIASDTRADGTAGGVLHGVLSARQALATSYTGTDYVVQVYGKQVGGRMWGVGTRVSNGVSNMYTANIYDDLNTTKNLYLYTWLNNPSNSATLTLGNAAVGTVSPNIWYQLMVKVHSINIDVYKNGVLQIHGVQSSLPSGKAAIYGEVNTTANFSNMLIRKYAATEPTVSLGSLSTFGGLAVSSVALNPANVVGGNSSQGTVTLSAPAPSGGAVVALTSSNTTAAQVP